MEYNFNNISDITYMPELTPPFCWGQAIIILLAKERG